VWRRPNAGELPRAARRKTRNIRRASNDARLLPRPEPRRALGRVAGDRGPSFIIRSAMSRRGFRQRHKPGPLLHHITVQPIANCLRGGKDGTGHPMPSRMTVGEALSYSETVGPQPPPWTSQKKPERVHAPQEATMVRPAKAQGPFASCLQGPPSGTTGLFPRDKHTD